MVAGALVGLIALRRTGIYFAMITVAIAEVFFFVENSPLSDYTGGENGAARRAGAESFQIGSYVLRIGTGWSMFHFWRYASSSALVLARIIVRSPVGAILVAIRDNPLRVQALGHSVWLYKLTAFVIASAYAGFRGRPAGRCCKATCRPRRSPSTRPASWSCRR